MQSLPVPRLPDGCSRRRFADEIMNWGRGDYSARGRIQSLTVEELTSNGVTLEIVMGWASFYRHIKKLSPKNPSAEGRAELMEHAAQLLRDLKQ